MHVGALEVDLHIPDSRSLKAKRAVVRPIVEGVRHRFSVAAAEVGHLDQWQRAGVGVAAVAGTVRHVTDVLDEVERFIWAQPGIEVLSAERIWLEPEPAASGLGEPRRWPERPGGEAAESGDEEA